jgi:hypothetical protein
VKSSSATVHLGAIKISASITCEAPTGDVMERRDFLKFAFGFAAGAAALAASAQAAPLLPQPLAENAPLPPSSGGAQPAVTTANEVERLTPEQVRWRRRWRFRRRRRWGFRRRYWGFRRRRWRRRWRRRYW